jgi:Na+/H+ antiporter NhaD/arsenite permease-like protein
MSDFQVVLVPIVFAAVILAIAFNLLDMALAAMLSVSAMLLFGAFTRNEFLKAAQNAGRAITLLFGGMVVARTLVPTGIFDQLGARYLLATRGSGKRFLLGLVILPFWSSSPSSPGCSKTSGGSGGACPTTFPCRPSSIDPSAFSRSWCWC